MKRLLMILDAKLVAKPESPVIQDGGAWGFDLEVFDMSRWHVILQSWGQLKNYASQNQPYSVKFAHMEHICILLCDSC